MVANNLFAKAAKPQTYGTEISCSPLSLDLSELEVSSCRIGGKFETNKIRDLAGFSRSGMGKGEVEWTGREG